MNLSLHAGENGPCKELTTIIDELEKKVPFEILCDPKTQDFLPKEWVGGEINGKVIRATDENIIRFLKDVSPSFKFYPHDVLKKNLKELKITESLSFYQVCYGGTYSAECVFVTVKDMCHGYTKKYNIDTFHHEFSSILMRNYREEFPHHKWAKVNGKDFKYRGSGVESIKEGTADNSSENETLRRAGFLSEYATSSLEEDFNTFAGKIFSDPEEMKKLVEAYPKIKQKYDLWYGFMKKISKDFKSPLDT